MENNEEKIGFPQYEVNEEVDALIERKTPLGFVATVDGLYTGLIYMNQVFQFVRIGDHLRAWVKQVREDGKIDLSLQPMGYRNVIDSVEAAVLRALHNNDGFLPLTDKSDPLEIAKTLQCSKKNFKKAVGDLYKHQRISIEENGIRFLK